MEFPGNEDGACEECGCIDTCVCFFDWNDFEQFNLEGEQ